ncbi:hypothetical protein TRV_01382 [Trichophyton verrucosum HKI 0517]|uniref:MoaB/Mog domain-containing protein n=1 Tax=Trichophyton verrucosum (strain HKI 0517) TaxID=663202 RepID=D4D2S6_TRIVH|nr:uncharacterized protein TRV_01382 [Trichophyton verrucosum HKI 0517]EFE43808.1 hypothetical protein TRV_01382 [Trichophyton verrucosum HKI 0517]
MSDQRFRAAILIVSDTAARDPSTDAVGGILTDVFSQHDRWEKPTIAIVPDSILEIQRHISRWSDGNDHFNLIITSGGTGFAVRDNTPEVGCSPDFYRTSNMKKIDAV